MAEKRWKELTITIDGPSGAGKSTVAKMLAAALGYTYIDTGAMYRGIAYAFLKQGVDEKGIEDFLNRLSMRFEFKDTARIFLDNEDISDKIRDQAIALAASRLSQIRAIREYLNRRQREIGGRDGVIVEGRDAGSVVFPYADVKFYLDASPDERARRRYRELVSKGVGSADITTVKEEMLKRDRDDSERPIAPLVAPADSVRVDTTEMDVGQVIDRLLQLIAGRGV